MVGPLTSPYNQTLYVCKSATVHYLSCRQPNSPKPNLNTVCVYILCMYVCMIECMMYSLFPSELKWSSDGKSEFRESRGLAGGIIYDLGGRQRAAIQRSTSRPALYIHTYIHTYIHRTLDVLILYECTYGIGSEDSIYTGVRGKLWTNLEPSHHNIVQGQFALLGESIDHNCGLEHTCKLRRRAHLRKKTVATICELAHSSEQIRGSGNVPPSRSPRWWTCADPPALRHPRIAFRRPCRTGRLPPPERTECGGPGTWSWPPAAPAR